MGMNEKEERMASVQDLVESIRSATQEVVNRDGADPLDQGWVKLITEVDRDLWDIIEDIDSDRMVRR
jgi:hypothetical protein